MSKITCFNGSNLEQSFNNNKATEQYEENAAVQTSIEVFNSIQADLNNLKEELGLPTETLQAEATMTEFTSEFVTNAMDSLKSLSDTQETSSTNIAEDYKNRITAIKEQKPNEYWSVDIPSDEVIMEAARAGRIVQNEGGMSIVTEDGNVVGVFKDKDGFKGVADDLLQKSVTIGAVKLDNYDGYLTKIYQRNGFRVVSRLAFNEEVAPPKWKKELHGTPDVVFMIYDPNNQLNIQEKSFDKDSYDAAEQYRDSFIEVAKKIHPFYKLSQNNTGKTQAFFSDVVEGKSAKYKAKKEWTPLLSFNQAQQFFKGLYDRFKGNFDNHIATSIPTFRETQIKVGATLVKMFYKKPEVVNKELEAVKNKYISEQNIKTTEPTYTTLDENIFSKIADYHTTVQDDRQNSEMKESYRAFLDETKKQYEYLVSQGYVIEPWMGEGEPYGVNSDLVRKDVLENKHLYYLRSRSATGDNNETDTAENYAPFESTGIVINGDDVLFNDLFRAVHDIFGHAMVKNTFSAQGELNAYKTHSPMYSNKAQKALFLETVVYNAYYKKNKNYAPRKIYDIPQSFLNDINSNPLIYDIGGSEGGFVKAITQSSNGSIKSINLDVNDSMEAVHNATPVEGSTFIKEAFYEEYTDEDTGVTYKRHVPQQKADVVHESMVFQFISPERGQFIKEVRDNYLKEDGILLLEEKLVPETQEEWLKNEELKDSYKREFYSQAEITEKQEEILTGMLKNQTKVSDLLNELNRNFDYVGQYWEAGNFKGFIATNSKQRYEEFLSELGGKIEFFPSMQNFSLESKEPSLKYFLDGKVHPSFKDALRASKEGDKIQVGVNTINGFKELYSIEANTNPSTFEGMVNNLIKDGLLTGETYQDGETTVYKTEGNSLVKKTFSAEFTKDYVRKYKGFNAVKGLKNGDIVLTESSTFDSIYITLKNGEKKQFKKSELDAMTFKELSNKFEDPIGTLAERDLRETSKALVKTQEQQEIVPENELQLKLLNLLNKMGVSTMSIADYIEKFGIKNGAEPSAMALADLAEKIVAFKDGVITTEELSEEVAHFIIAATPQAEKENLLRNIHKTQEWAEFQELYREVYGAQLKGQALEEAVREEILGKVLANAFTRNFAKAQNRNQTELSILDKLVEIARNFFQKISDLFTTNFQNELDTYTEQVYSNLMRETLDVNMSNINQKFNMFSIFTSTANTNPLSPIYVKASQALDLLTSQEYKLSKNRGSITKEQLKEQRQRLESMDELERLKALSGIAIIADKQLKHLERALNQNRGINFPFTQEENTVYQSFNTVTLQSLSEMNALLDPKNKDHKKIIDSISNILGRVAGLRGKLGVKENTSINALVGRVVQKHNLTQAQADEYRKIIETAKYKDTAWFQANFGSMVQASNPLLNLAGDVIAKTIKDEREVYLPNIKNFINALTAANFDPRRLKEFIKDGYIESEIDWKALEDYEATVKAEIYSNVKGTPTTKDEYLVLEKEGILEMDALQIREFNKQFKERSKEWKEQFFTDAYLEEQEKLFKDIPVEAVEYHKKDRAQRSDINASVTREDGRIVHTINSAADIQELNKKRAQNMHPRDANGDLKVGLIEGFNSATNEYEYSLTNNPSEEARLAYGLWKINELNRAKFQNTPTNNVGIPQSFLDMLKGGESIEEKLELLFNNAYVGFNDSFWENFGGSSLVEDLRDVDEDLAEDIRKQQQIIAGVLKQNRVLNRPSETDANSLTAEEKATIRNATESLEALYQEASKALPDRERIETDSVSGVNEAYTHELQDQGIDEIEFILRNTTSSGKSAIERLQNAAKKVKRGDLAEYKDILNDSMTDAEIDQAVIDYARTRVLPYYKRTEPQGYTELLESVREESITIEEFISSPIVKVKPNFSFYDTVTNDNVNQTFLDNRNEGKPQIKKGFFVNTDFTNKYGKITNGVAERNNDAYQAREALLNLQRSTLQNLNLEGKHNLYKLPQVGKKGLRQAEDFVKGEWRETLKDLVTFREDELEFGRGRGVIPQYYTKDLENQNDVTDELLYSYALMAQQSALYKARVENIGDMLSIQQSILNADFGEKSKEATNTYKMFQSYMDYNFYGIKETFSYQADIFGFKVDLAKVARRFHKWVQTVNLTGLIVPLTSALTGSVMKRLESVIGERINPIAERLANKEYMKLASAAAGESFGFNSNARMNVLGEAYGVYDVTQGRFENSTHNKFTRGLTKWADLTHSMSNFTVNPRVMLAVLMDNRYYNGRVVSLNQYRRLEKEKGQKTEKEIKEGWKNLELFYTDIITENGIRSFDKQSMITKLGLTGTQEENEFAVEEILGAINESIATRVSTAIQEIDTQIPASEKSIAARHGIANFFLMHSNWILLATQRKFKNRHLNLNTGEMEEGNFVGTYNFIKQLVPSKAQAKDYFKHVKEVWDNADDVTRKSLHRTMMEMAFVNTLLVMSYILSNMMDDDKEENSWMLEFSNYMLFRVTNETLSSTVALPRQFSETVNNPLKGIDRFYDLKDITDIFNTDVVASGKYAGETRSYRWIARNMPAIKDYQRIVNIDKETDLYKMYNKENMVWSLFAYHLLTEE